MKSLEEIEIMIEEVKEREIARESFEYMFQIAAMEDLRKSYTTEAPEGCESIYTKRIEDFRKVYD